MIRVRKSTTVPQSLTTTSSYDGEDVKEQLFADQDEKCYLCERTCCTDFQIEHHKSKSEGHFPELRQDWDNLFMGCSYCNGKKSDLFDDTLYPATINIEDEIEQRIDFLNKKAVFTSNTNGNHHNQTIGLLSRIHNGTKSLRRIKEERFIEYVISVVNSFLALIKDYQEHPSIETENAVRRELCIDKEMLGFKYWIIKDNADLYRVFAPDIVWNKQ
jgi:hypothetical protein